MCIIDKNANKSFYHQGRTKESSLEGIEEEEHGLIILETEKKSHRLVVQRTST